MNADHIAIGYRALEPVEVSQFNLSSWQNMTLTNLSKTTKELNCGTTACAGGCLALSPEFIELGGGIDSAGSPTFKYSRGADALRIFYGNANALEDDIINIIHFLGSIRKNTPDFYGVEFLSQVTPKMVQEKFAVLYFILKFLEKE